jgi:carboxymethylenebutenolidase
MGEQITLNASDGHVLSAWRAEPRGAPRGGVAVVQEIFGVNAHIRDVVDSFAAEGYVAIAPALFDRVEPGIELDYDEAGRDRGRALRPQIGWEQTVADVTAAVAVLPEKTGVVGYCWGGSVAWLAATRIDGIAAAVCYYGGQIKDFLDETPRCPVLLHFGGADKSIPMESVSAIRKAHPGLPLHVYEGAGHGFNCDRRGSYDRAASVSARQRTMALLADSVG